MADTVDFKYRAFLSYAHADTRWAKWLHGRLEGFRIDRDLVGRPTALGPVPKALRPIFRDREDFSGGHSLNDATLAALDASAALIVLCSPAAAASRYVDEEVRLFRLRHPSRPVIPVIVAGTPGATPNGAVVVPSPLAGEGQGGGRDTASDECFPPALRFEIAADGTISDRPHTLLGPDLRESADGRELGLAKIAAGLTGLAPDDLYRRAERARRRQSRLRATIAATFLAIVAGGGFFAWQNWQRQQTLSEIEALVARYSATGEAQAASPGAGQSLKEAITSIAQGAASDPRYREALDLLKAGKPKEAEPLLAAVAADRKKRAQQNAKEAAAAYRNLAAIKRVSDPRSAREAYAEAAALDAEHVEGLFNHGWFQKDAGNLAPAEAAFEKLLSISKSGPDDYWIFWSRMGLGDIRTSRGNLAAAMAAYREAMATAEQNAKTAPLESRWQRDLSVSHSNIGGILRAGGNLPAALESHRTSLAIRERLFTGEPDNSLRQRDLLVSHGDMGDILLAQGSLQEAIKHYRAALAIAEGLVKADPENTRRQRELAVSLDRIGDILMRQRDLPGAVETYRKLLATTERLARTDPDNAAWQHDLSISHNKIGDVLRAQGDSAGALQGYRASLAIRERLANANPGNAELQRSLSVSHSRIGDVIIGQGDPRAALEYYRASLTIAERLARIDQGNSSWQRDLSVAEEKIGDVLAAEGNLPVALEAYRKSLATRERLVDADASNGIWQVDLAGSFGKTGRLLVRMGDKEQALAMFRKGRAIVKPLAERSGQRTLLDYVNAFDADIAALEEP